MIHIIPTTGLLACLEQSIKQKAASSLQVLRRGLEAGHTCSCLGENTGTYYCALIERDE